jgi:hypothetical protein
VCIFGLTQKCTKKVKAVKKWLDALLRSTEISQTHSRSNMRNFGCFASMAIFDRFHPGSPFFKAGEGFLSTTETSFERTPVRQSIS